MEADFLMKFPDEEYDVIVDAIFGVGLKREVAGRHREVIELPESDGSTEGCGRCSVWSRCLCRTDSWYCI